jgi:O-antigen ligase
MSSRLSPRLDNTIAVGLLILVCFTALAHGAVEGWSVALFLILVAVLFLLWGVKALADGALTLRGTAAGLPLAGFLLLGLVQSIAVTGGDGRLKSLSLDVEATRLTVVTLAALIVSHLLAANFITSRERLRALANFLSVYGLAMAVFALLQHFTWNGRFYWLRPTLSEVSHPFGPFVNHNHFAGYMELLVGVPLGLIVARGVRREERVFFGFAAAMMGTALILSLSRGGMVSLFAQLMFVAAMSGQLPHLREARLGAPLRGRLARAGAVLALGAAILAGVLWVGADTVANRLAGQEDETFFSSRGWIWRDTLRVVGASPILGNGLGAFQTAFPGRTDYDGIHGYVAQSHNDYLQVLADGGIIAAALAVWFIVVVFRDLRRGLRARDPLLAGLALGCGAGIFGMLTHSLFDFNLQLPANSLLFLLLAAVVSTIGRLASGPAAEVELPRQARLHAPSFTVGASQ